MESLVQRLGPHETSPEIKVFKYIINLTGREKPPTNAVGGFFFI
jgi:hypothetical protein